MSETRVTDTTISLDGIITKAIQLPGVRVDRKQFLTDIFSKDWPDISEILEVGPVEAGCSRETLRHKAKTLVLDRTAKSSAMSFAAGLPGGLAMAATIPADVLQFFGMALRLAQELYYLYGGEDLWHNSNVDDEAVKHQLIMYCGVMFGVSGAVSGVRLLSSNIAKMTMKKLPQKALTKTFWYPIVKQIGKAIGVKVTKTTVANGVSKSIPIIGGVISGSLNFASMKPMGDRLADTLDDATFDYTEAEVMADLDTVGCMAKEAPEAAPAEKRDGVFSGIKNMLHRAPKAEDAKAAEDPIEKLKQLAQLKDAGIITEAEFEAKKKELLSKI